MVGRILDAHGNPIEGLTVISAGFIFETQSVELVSDPLAMTTYQNYYDTTNLAGEYSLSSGLNYWSSTEPNQFGCSSSGAFTSVQNSFVGIVNSTADTLIVLFSIHGSDLADTLHHLYAYADTTIDLQNTEYDYYHHPLTYGVPDIIDHRSTL